MNQNIKLNWKLDKSLFKKSIFLKKNINEKCDKKMIYGFIKNEMGIKLNKKNIKYTTELQHIKEYKNLYNKTEDRFITKFILPNHEWGRIIPINNLSLSIFHRPTRHALCLDNYIDIDIENSIACIIYQMCKINKHNVEAIKYYCENPKQIRQQIMDYYNCNKDIAKKLPIKIMHGGLYKNWIIENGIIIDESKKPYIDIITNIENEMKSIIEIVYGNNSHIKDDVLKFNPDKWKNTNEEKRGVMALWYQSIERLIQETTIQFLVDNKNFKLEDIIPCQDGFMILKELWQDDFLNDIHHNIYIKFNLNITFANKPFDEAIIIPKFEDFLSFNEWEDQISSKMLANIFIKNFNDNIVLNDNGIYVFLNNRWKNDKNRYILTILISENLYDIVKNFIINDVSLNDKELNYLLKNLRIMTSNENKRNDIIKHILSIKHTQNNYIIFDNNPFLLGFENGVLDLLHDDIIFRDYKYDDYITLSTKYDYYKPDYTNEQYKKLYNELENIFNDIEPDNEQLLLLLQILASGLDGLLYQKIFNFCGKGGNGKGLIASLMSSILGEYYHQPSNGIIKDAEKANVPSPDMYNLMNKRYINFKEVIGGLNISFLRNLTGGGDFHGRLLNQNPVKFQLNASIVMEYNNDPELIGGKPMESDYRRYVVKKFTSNYTDDPNKINKTIGGVTYKQANTYYTSIKFINDIKLIFLDLLIDVYKFSRDFNNKFKGIIFNISQKSRDDTNKFIENQNILFRLFNKYFVKSDIKININGKEDKFDKKNKTITLKDIWNTIKDDDEYKRQNIRDKKQNSRDELYTLLETMFPIYNDHNIGKLIFGLVRKDFINNDSVDYDILIDKLIDDIHNTPIII
jgi:hypothetical protein